MEESQFRYRCQSQSIYIVPYMNKLEWMRNTYTKHEKYTLNDSGNKRLTFKYKLSLKMQRSHTRKKTHRNGDGDGDGPNANRKLFMMCVPVKFKLPFHISCANNFATDYLQRIMDCLHSIANDDAFMHSVRAHLIFVFLHIYLQYWESFHANIVFVLFFFFLTAATVASIANGTPSKKVYHPIFAQIWRSLHIISDHYLRKKTFQHFLVQQLVFLSENTFCYSLQLEFMRFFFRK